ncbi:MAG: ATP-binding protein [Desulfobacteraceae bacterium]|nr:ATP-binding protein [Desulfobacteraceae bacterium]
MKSIRLAALLLVVVVIGILHFITPGDLLFYHDTLRRLSYFPIALGGLWYGVPGGLGIAVASSIAFIPHLVIYAGHHPAMYMGELTEVVLYLAAGALIGAIAGKEARLREQYRLLSEKLERSYDRLHEQAALLLEVEGQLGASQRLSALGQLAASLAHEIKNPLSSIRGTAEILLDEFPPGHPKREFAEILLKETARLGATVENVLQYSRGQQQAQAAEPLGRVLSRVATLLGGQLRGKKIDFRLRVDEEAAAVLVDGARLSQVFLNLILNAIDAVEANGRIIVESGRAAGGIAISVSDNGPGVPGDQRERIFEPFVSRKGEGTGLGLSISRKIVESYGGRIEISEAPEGGARFTVFLPSGGSPQF